MTITWPNTSTTICHGNTRALTEARGPYQWQSRTLPTTIRRDYIEAPGPAYDDVHHTAVEIAFRVVRVYASPADAATAGATLSHPAATGSLAFAGHTLIGALLTLSVHTEGAALHLQYRFQGRLV